MIQENHGTSDRVALVTGAAGGLGRATAVALARKGATVVIVARSADRGAEALSEVRAVSPKGCGKLLSADLSSLTDVRRLAQEFASSHPRLDVLINNAAVSPGRRQVTSEGLEAQFATNFLSPFLLTHLLLDTLKASTPSRVVNVSSAAHAFGRIRFDDLQSEKRYSNLRVYGASKLALMLFSYELARRLERTGVTVNCLDPGGVNSGITRNAGWFPRLVTRLFGASPEHAAKTPVYVATTPQLAGVTGKYFQGEREKRSSKASYDRELGLRVWEVAEKMTGLA
jgi:NAD(P)-dependent dehydrogenase (short-subunit alcohol dehydrogenase family)